MTISFLGTILFVRGRCYRDPDVFLDGLRILAAEHPQVARQLAVRFVGRCPSVAERAAARGLTRLVEVRELVSVAESRRMMADSDVLLHLQTLDEASKDCIAAKLFDYLGARRPILAIVTPGGGDDWLLRQCDAGTRLGIDDPGRWQRHCGSCGSAGAAERSGPTSTPPGSRGSSGARSPQSWQG